MKIELVNTCRNEDLAFIADKLLSHAQFKDNNVTVSLSTVKKQGNQNKLDDGVRQVFESLSASSPLQLLNVIPAIKISYSLSRGDTLVLTSPTILNILFVVLQRFFKYKIIALIHDPVPHYGGIRGLLYKIQNHYIISSAQTLFAFSNHSTKQLQRKHSNVITLPLCSPAEAIDTSRLDASKKYDYIWLGRDEEYKGSKFLPGFARQCKTRQKTLLIVGSVDKTKTPWITLSKLNNVTIIDRRVSDDELVELTLQSRMNLCPYISATQSGVIPFCTCLGIPSTAHDVGGLSEQINSNVTGMVTDISNIVNLHRDFDSQKIKDWYTNHYHSKLTAKIFWGTLIEESAV